VAAKLGNRPATCRKYYVHPVILDAYMNGRLLHSLERHKGARRAERCVLELVKRYAAGSQRKIRRA